MAEINIVAATLWDMGDIRRLEKASFDQDSWPLIEMIGVLSFPSVQRWKAMRGDELVGFVAADERVSQGLAWIATIAVSPYHRRKGLGNQLLEKAESAVSVPLMRLSVRAKNSGAIQLYQKRGYVQIDVWPSYYTGGEDAIVMEKKLEKQ
jgi:ribosomal protein S18 acetylase RimI-like enzyme